MIDLPTLKGLRVTLRRPQKEDADVRLSLGRHPEIAEMFGVSREHLTTLTRSEAESWLSDLQSHPYAWVIEFGSMIGSIRLEGVDLRDQRASLAIGILTPALLGKGLGTESNILVLDFAFNVLRLHRVSVRVLAYNERAIRCYQKCGFIIEGRERETAFVNGKWHDDIMMGLLSREFRGNDRS